jgi:hypothetical protein
MIKNFRRPILAPQTPLTLANETRREQKASTRRNPLAFAGFSASPSAHQIDIGARLEQRIG